jgi:hypothetical protein
MREVEDRLMFRWVVTAFCLGAFCLCLGCGTKKDHDPNPDLPYSKDVAPDRGGAKPPK